MLCKVETWNEWLADFIPLFFLIAFAVSAVLLFQTAVRGVLRFSWGRDACLRDGMTDVVKF